jgi:diadenosine tetraphosphate (Ap4A) HIT family hydrolase
MSGHASIARLSKADKIFVFREAANVMLESMTRRGEAGNMSGDTRFAWIMDDTIPRSGALWDREILRTDRFVAVPSAGSLVAGWTLVVPRRPMLNLSQTKADERVELDAISNRIADWLGRRGQEVYFFEHGSRSVGSLTGCGVDQAHLHVVPLPFDLIAAATARTEAGIVWRDARETEPPFDTLPVHGEYVALWSRGDRRTMIGAVTKPVSQWIRRVIADELGIGAQWNYRRHPQLDRVRETLALLRSLQIVAVGQ